MANRIKGITVEIGGDTTGLQKALKDVNKDLYNIQSDLKDVDRLLKIDPKNTELLAQKQRLLVQAIADTRSKLETLREAEKQVQDQFKQGKVSEEQYNALKREIVATEQAERSLSAQLKDTKKSMDEQDESLEKSIISAELAKDALVKLGKAVLDLAKDAVSYNAQMESYTAAFASFLGSAEEAQKAIARIKEDASTMPFGTSELVEANQLLITAGEGAEDARQNINALAAAVAATGGGNAELSRMAANLQQIKNTGKATSVDIKQFANAGINIYGLLADYAAATNQDLEKMEYSYENITGAIKMATEEGGRYYGAMEAQADTYNGQLQALKARIQDTMGNTFKSVSDTLKNEVFPAINRALDSIDFEKLADSINSIVTAISAILPVVTFVVGTAIDLLGGVMAAITPIVDDIKKVLDNIIDLVVNVFSGRWKEAWTSIVRLVQNLFATIVDSIIGVVNSIITALNKVISWFTGNASTISKIPGVSTWQATSTTSSSGRKVLPGGQSLMASGGVLANGTTLVGDNGPELLTVNNGVATVQPVNNTTTNLGGINMSIYGSAGQNVHELADIVMDRIQMAVTQKGAVWA